jgi:NADPH-dependent 2,4-dienoyl-CoA reductase/sulfur reductase-like enzyme
MDELLSLPVVGSRPRVVIVGGGFAGIAAARALRHGEADVVLLDRRNHHIFQPLLYQVATGLLAPSEVFCPDPAARAAAAEPHRHVGRSIRFVTAWPLGADLFGGRRDARTPL